MTLLCRFFFFFFFPILAKSNGVEPERNLSEIDSIQFNYFGCFSLFFKFNPSGITHAINERTNLLYCDTGHWSVWFGSVHIVESIGLIQFGSILIRF